MLQILVIIEHSAGDLLEEPGSPNGNAGTYGKDTRDEIRHRFRTPPA